MTEEQRKAQVVYLFTLHRPDGTSYSEIAYVDVAVDTAEDQQ